MKYLTKVSLGILFILTIAIACKNRYKDASKHNPGDEFPPEMVDFIAADTAPLFSGSGTNTWDKKIRERGFILYEDSIYKMWYTGYNPDIAREKFLGYATSTDGINWFRYSDKPVFREKWTEDIFVTKYRDVYYMFAEGDQDIAHLMTSSDGINWMEQGDLIITTTKGDTISGPYGTPTVWIEKDKWYLFYERNDSAIWLAESGDRINWQNIQDEPVLKCGPDSYDIAAVAVNQVIKWKGNYFMYYHATSSLDWQHPVSPVIWTSNVAMSEDLVHWVKYPGNPIVKDDHSSPILVFDQNGPNLYTMHSKVCRFVHN